MTSRGVLLVGLFAFFPTTLRADELPWVVVSKDKKGFVLESSGKSFAPWGFNYDHDDAGRLIEDYWEKEWPKVEADFAQMKKLGANVVRVHLQFGKFMTATDKPNAKALDQLAKLLRVAETNGLYLNLTGLGCYHKEDVPAWYDKLTEAERWDSQARFWEAVAGRCAKSPAVFCYDLMNEPVVPGGKRKDGDWLGPAFGDKHFVQFITLDQKDRPRPDIARQWIEHLVAAVRKVDSRHLITVGLLDWSLDRKGLTSGFVPEKVCGKLDFVCVHIYPEAGKLDEALKTLKGFGVGKPVVVEETFPLKCSGKDLDAFIDKAGTDAAGWISFYWGTPPDKLRQSKEIKNAILLDWLERFQKRAAPHREPQRKKKASADSALSHTGGIMADPLYKQMTALLLEFGISDQPHTGKTYIGHLLAVHRLMEEEGCGLDACRAGLFHSIYGTELFQGFILPLERRAEARAMIGERAERLAYLNCAMDRATFDAVLEQPAAPFLFRDRLSGAEVALTREDFDDLCRVHLYDWLEQAPRSRHGFAYRRSAYRRMAERLGPNAVAAFDRVFAGDKLAPG